MKYTNRSNLQFYNFCWGHFCIECNKHTQHSLHTSCCSPLLWKYLSLLLSHFHCSTASLLSGHLREADYCPSTPHSGANMWAGVSLDTSHSAIRLPGLASDMFSFSFFSSFIQYPCLMWQWLVSCNVFWCCHRHSCSYQYATKQSQFKWSKRESSRYGHQVNQ